MSIAFTCPGCGCEMVAADDSGGKSVLCRRCGVWSCVPDVQANVFHEFTAEPRSPRKPMPVLYRWLIALAVLIAIVVAYCLSKDSPESIPGGMAGACILLAVIAVIHYSQRPCPRCRYRWTLTRRHVRKDGQPDRRYKHNPLDCSSCGWSGY